MASLGRAEAHAMYDRVVTGEEFGEADFATALLGQNEGRNRYSNVPALEATRVRLQDGEYVNANWVAGARYVLTQGPLAHTVAAFWRMVEETGARVVVMVARLVENGRPKVHRYWPGDGAAAEAAGLRLLGVEEAARGLPESVAAVLRGEFRASIVHRAFTLRGRRVDQLQYLDWPDHGVPASVRSLLALREAEMALARGAPAVVHCSAGIGRSGTYAAISIAEQLMGERKPGHAGPVPPPRDLCAEEALWSLRSERYGAVQTPEQFYFVVRGLQELHAARVNNTGSEGERQR